MTSAHSSETARRRCATCGVFVPKHHLATVWHSYAIDHEKPVAVYSQATATNLRVRLDCRSCSMRDCLLREAEREYGVAVGRHLPNGWEKCAPTATQADYEQVLSPGERPGGGA